MTTLLLKKGTFFTKLVDWDTVFTKLVTVSQDEFNSGVIEESKEFEEC